jgi:peptidoglycan/LPS O-acetylase OafA/YrhL
MTTAPSTMKPLHALSAFRFFAAVLVVFAHFHYTFWPNVIYGPFGDFSTVVSFFFMLSGFTLTYAHPPAKPLSFRTFMLRRLARLWPIHLILLGFTFLFLPKIVAENQLLKEYNSILAANLFLLHAWLPIQNYFFSFNAPTWYLSTQLALYLGFPWLNANFQKNWPYKLLVSLLLFVGILGLASLLPLFSKAEMSGQGLLYISPLTRGLEFLLGMVGALLFSSKIAHCRLSTIKATVLECLAVLLVLVAMANTGGFSPLLANVPVIGPALAFYWEFAGMTLVPFFVLIQVFALGQGALSRFFSKPLFQFLGAISFEIYMLHIVLLHYYLYPLALKPHIPMPSTERIIIYWILLILCAYLFQRYIEKPLSKGILTACRISR